MKKKRITIKIIISWLLTQDHKEISLQNRYINSNSSPCNIMLKTIMPRCKELIIDSQIQIQIFWIILQFKIPLEIKTKAPLLLSTNLIYARYVMKLKVMLLLYHVVITLHVLSVLLDVNAVLYVGFLLKISLNSTNNE